MWLVRSRHFFCHSSLILTLKCHWHLHSTKNILRESQAQDTMVIASSNNKDKHRPAYEGVVKLLCLIDGEKKKKVLKNGNKSEEMHWFWNFPKKDLCKIEDKCTWMRKNHGCTNAFNHLVIGVWDGDKEETCKIYENNLQAKQRAIEGFFEPIFPISTKDQ